MTDAAVLSSGGKFKILQKSEPVPRGTIPSVTSFEIKRPFSKNPFTTSLMVPSPPTAMMVVAPLVIAFAVSSIPCPGALVSSVFVELDLKKVDLRTSVENARSRALAERLGFSFEGVLPAGLRFSDRADDVALYGVTADKWSALHSRSTPR